MTPHLSEVRSLEIRTGCRLHFGLMELCPDQEFRFAGLGLMLQHPGWHFTVNAGQAGDQVLDSAIPVSAAFASARHQPRQQTLERYAVVLGCNEVCCPDDADEIQQRISNILTKRSNSNACFSVRVQESLPLHSGLGSGTQLACAIASSQEVLQRAAQSMALPLSQASGWMDISTLLTEVHAAELAHLAGRGLRSAIGLKGFLDGGMVLDRGYAGQNSDSRPVVATSRTVPLDWRVILIQPPRTAPIAGQQEMKLLEAMAAKPNPASNRMFELANNAIDMCRDFVACTSCIEEYMKYAAEMFAPWQGGLYNGPAVACAVAAANSLGLSAVGQSSWGPSVFGLTDDPDRAGRVAQQLRERHPDWKVALTRPAPCGAQVLLR